MVLVFFWWGGVLGQGRDQALELGFDEKLEVKTRKEKMNTGSEEKIRWMKKRLQKQGRQCDGRVTIEDSHE